MAQTNLMDYMQPVQESAQDNNAATPNQTAPQTTETPVDVKKNTNSTNLNGYQKTGTSEGASSKTARMAGAEDVLKNAVASNESIKNELAKPTTPFVPYPFDEATANKTATDRYKDFQDFVEKTKPPTMEDAIQGYDQAMANTRKNLDQVNANKKWGELGDLGLLVGDYIGAKGGANVNVRQPVTQQFNDQAQKLADLYQKYQSDRPEKHAQLQLEDYKNKLGYAENNIKAKELTYNYVDKMQTENYNYNKLLLEAKAKGDEAEVKKLEGMINANNSNIKAASASNEQSYHKSQQAIQWANYGLRKKEFDEKVKENKDGKSYTIIDNAGGKHVVPKSSVDGSIGQIYRDLVKDHPEQAVVTSDGKAYKANPTFAEMKAAVLKDAGAYSTIINDIESIQDEGKSENVDLSPYLQGKSGYTDPFANIPTWTPGGVTPAKTQNNLGVKQGW